MMMLMASGRSVRTGFQTGNAGTAGKFVDLNTGKSQNGLFCFICQRKGGRIISPVYTTKRTVGQKNELIKSLFSSIRRPDQMAKETLRFFSRKVVHMKMYPIQLGSPIFDFDEHPY